jgi:hypothetical protein
VSVWKIPLLRDFFLPGNVPVGRGMESLKEASPVVRGKPSGTLFPGGKGVLLPGGNSRKGKSFFPEKRFPFLCQPSGKNGKTFARNQNRRMNFWVKRFRFPRFAGKVHGFLQDFTSCPLTCLAKVVYYGRLGTPAMEEESSGRISAIPPEHKNAKEPLI